MNKVVFSRQSDEWATPQDVFDMLDAEFHFDLDPCATDENHKCERYFTKENDGKAQKWGGAGYFAIHRIQKSLHGLRRHIGKQERTERLLSY